MSVNVSSKCDIIVLEKVTVFLSFSVLFRKSNYRLLFSPEQREALTWGRLFLCIKSSFELSLRVLGVALGLVHIKNYRKGVDMDKLKIVYKKIDDLTPYENNPRLNDGAVDAVAKSIEEFGFKVPIVIDKDGVIVAGHTRLKAAKQLHIDEVPCIIADDLSDEELKAFRLADNKVSELAEWDFDKLDAELKNIDFDMSDFGFDFNTIDEENDKFDDADTEYHDINDKTIIAIEFDTEQELESAFQKLNDEGYNCQILTL